MRPHRIFAGKCKATEKKHCCWIGISCSDYDYGGDELEDEEMAVDIIRGGR